VRELAEKTGQTQKDTAAIISAYEDIVTETLASGEKVSFSGFLTLDVKSVEARKYRNPQTGKDSIVPKHNKVSVKVGKALKDEVKKAVVK
jgi:DNA-binding protein HU-beta